MKIMFDHFFHYIDLDGFGGFDECDEKNENIYYFLIQLFFIIQLKSCIDEKNNIDSHYYNDN